MGKGSKRSKAASARSAQWLKQAKGQAEQAEPSAPACDNTDAIDSQVERFLQSHGVKYAPKKQIPLDVIDEKSSLGNQARDVPIIPENVDRYAQSIKKGEYLPPIIVFPSGNKVTVVDGNNRHHAHKKAGSQFIPGFVIAEDTPSEKIALLTVAANTGHGETPNPKWRLRQAAYLVSLGYSTDQATSAAGVTKSQLSDYMATQRADARAKAMRVTNFTELPPTSRASLGRIPLDSVFYQATRTAIDTEMTSEEIRKMIKEVKALGTESEMIEHIGHLAGERKIEARKKESGAKGRVKSPVLGLNAALGMIMAADGAAISRQLLTDMDRQTLIRKLDAAGVKLIELQIAIQPAQEETA